MVPSWLQPSTHVHGTSKLFRPRIVTGMDQTDAMLTAIMLRAEWAADNEQVGHYIQRARLKQHAPDVQPHDRIILVSGVCAQEFVASFAPMRSYCTVCVAELGRLGRKPPALAQAPQLTEPPSQ
jgi:hypothetical protein